MTDLDKATIDMYARDYITDVFKWSANTNDIRTLVIENQASVGEVANVGMVIDVAWRANEMLADILTAWMER